MGTFAKRADSNAVFWIIIIIVVVIALATSISKGGSKVNRADTPEEKAILLVQDYGDKMTILEAITDILSSSEGAKVIGWSAEQKGSIYEVSFRALYGGETIVFIWDVDLLDNSVESANDNAKKIMKNVE